MSRVSTVKDINEAHIHVKCIECGEALIEYTPDITFRDVDMAIAAHEYPLGGCPNIIESLETV